MERDRWLETSEVAKRLRCSMTHVRTLIRTGKLAHTNIGAGDTLPRYRIPESSLIAFMAAAPEGGILERMKTRGSVP